MPDNTVSIQFVADTSSMTQAFAKLEGELASAGAKTVNWTNVQKMSAQAAEFMSAANYKTAASFKTATEAQRAASVAAQEGAKSMGNLASQVGLAYVAYRLLREAAEAVKYVATQSASLETASVRFSNLAGNTKASSKAFEELKAVAKATNTNIVELSQGATTMLEAGVKMDDLPKVMQSIADKANVAGSSVAELSDIYLRLESRGEISGRQLAMLSKVTGDEAGTLSAKYKDMTITIPLIAKEMERVQRATERTVQDSERLLNTQNAFLEKHGAQAGIEAAFKAQSGQGMAPYVPVAGMENVPGMGQGAVKAEWKYLKEGIKQLGTEEHISAQAMQGMVQSGAIGMDEVREAAKRAHEQVDITRQRANQDATTALEVKKEQERLEIAKQAAAGLLPSTDAGVVKKEAAQVAKVEATQEYNLRKAGNDVRDASQNAGDGLRGLSKWIEGVTKSLTGFDAAAHPIKGMGPEAGRPATTKKPGSPGFDWSTYKPAAEAAQPVSSGPAIRQWSIEDIQTGKNLPGSGISAPTSQIREPYLTGLSAGLKSGAPASEKTVTELQKLIVEGYDAPKKMMPLGPSSGRLDLTTTPPAADLAKLRPSAEMIARATPASGAFLPAGSGLSFFPGSHGPGGGVSMGAWDPTPGAGEAVRDQRLSGIAANYDWSLPGGGGKPAGAGSSGPAHVADPTMHDLMGRLLQILGEGA